MKVISSLLILCGLFMFSCSSSKMGMPNRSSAKKVETSASNLTEYLAQVPGIMVSGAEGAAKFKIRGINSINLNTEPLFIVDGSPMVGGYSTVYDLINIKDVESAKIVRGPEASFYGTRASAGVIKIELKK